RKLACAPGQRHSDFILRLDIFDGWLFSCSGPDLTLASGHSLRANEAMRPESLRFLQKLINTPSPPGHEAKGQRVWLDYVSEFADETFSDSYGNAVAIV